MEDFLASKRMIWIFVGIGLLAVLVIAITLVATSKSRPAGQNAVSPAKSQVVKTKVDPAKLPEKFPADFPQETGATILANDVQTTSDGKFQATRSYVSAKTLEDNVKIFQSYFQKTGWKVTSTVEQPRYKAISATKEDLNIQINMNDNQVTKQKTVDIYVVQKPVTK
jgi:hypothetical protein